MGRGDGKARMRPTGFAPARPVRQTHAWRMALMPHARARRRRPSSSLRGRAPAACNMHACVHTYDGRLPSLLPLCCRAPPSQAKPSVRTSACARARACTWVRVMEPRASHRLCERVERRSGERSPGADGGSGARGSCARIEPSGAARPCRAGAEQPVPAVTAVTAPIL